MNEEYEHMVDMFLHHLNKFGKWGADFWGITKEDLMHPSVNETKSGVNLYTSQINDWVKVSIVSLDPPIGDLDVDLDDGPLKIWRTIYHFYIDDEDPVSDISASRDTLKTAHEQQIERNAKKAMGSDLEGLLDL